MTMRLQLVIEGDSSGAKRALEDAGRAVEDLGGKARQASTGSRQAVEAATRQATEALSREFTEQVNLAREVEKLMAGVPAKVDLVTIAAGKSAGAFGGIVGALRGAAGSVAAGAAGGVVAMAAGGVIGAVTQFVERTLSGTRQMEEALARHKETIKALKGAWSEAAGPVLPPTA